MRTRCDSLRLLRISRTFNEEFQCEVLLDLAVYNCFYILMIIIFLGAVVVFYARFVPL